MQPYRAKIALLAVAGIATGVVPAIAQGSAVPTWKGAYRYEFNGGRTAGGSPIVVAYDLAIVPGAGRGGCLITASGFQTDERIVCHASGDAKALSITFHGYEDGRTVNKYGVAVYSRARPFSRSNGGRAGRP